MAQIPTFGFGFDHHGSENGSLLRGGYATNGNFTGQTHSQYKAPPGSSSGASSQRIMGWNFGGGQAHDVMNPYILVNYEVVAG
jgi:hypothetical protein